MAKVLSMDEMLQVMLVAEWPEAQIFRDQMETMASDMADIISDKLGCANRPAEFWDGETMACFSPLEEGGSVPNELSELDTDGDWIVHKSFIVGEAE